MITALILAASIHVLAQYEWTHWKAIADSGYNIYCSKLLCSVEESKEPWRILITESAPFNIYSWCDWRVTQQEFDQRITKWRDQGFPHGICEGKPIS